MFKCSRKAEGMLEYVLIIGAISLALTTMNFYLKRGIQARIRDITSSSIASPDEVRQLLSGDSYTGLYSSNTTITQTATTLNNTQGRTTRLISRESIDQSGVETQQETLNYWGEPVSPIPISRGMPNEPIYDREQAEQEAERRMQE